MLNFKPIFIDFYGYFRIIIEVMFKPYEVGQVLALYTLKDIVFPNTKLNIIEWYGYKTQIV